MVFIFFFLNSQAIQQNESLSFETQILQSGRMGKASVCYTIDSQNVGWQSQWTQSVTIHEASLDFIQFWQGDRDLAVSEGLVLLPCCPDNLLHWPQGLPSLTCNLTQTAKEEDRLRSKAHPPHPGEIIRCVLPLLGQAAPFKWSTFTEVHAIKRYGWYR